MDKYLPLNSKSMETKMNLLLQMWAKFLSKSLCEYLEGNTENPYNSIKIEDTYSVNVVALRELFERVNQRYDYYDRYHNKLKMSNYKEIGLIAFWIVKFKPFHLKEEFVDNYFDLRVNEEFALFFIFKSIATLLEKQNKTPNLDKIDHNLYNELIYTMQYRDVSKEVFGCIAELIAVAIEQV